jgi:hypothetical protein
LHTERKKKKTTRKKKRIKKARNKKYIRPLRVVSMRLKVKKKSNKKDGEEWCTYTVVMRGRQKEVEKRSGF